MHDAATHSFLSQIPLIVSPYLKLPQPVTLPLNYVPLPRSLPPSSAALFAEVKAIVSACEDQQRQILSQHEAAKAKVAAWESEVSHQETLQQRTIAPGYLDSEVHLLQPAHMEPSYSTTEAGLQPPMYQPSSQRNAPTHAMPPTQSSYDAPLPSYSSPYSSAPPSAYGYVSAVASPTPSSGSYSTQSTQHYSAPISHTLPALSHTSSFHSEASIQHTPSYGLQNDIPPSGASRQPPLSRRTSAVPSIRSTSPSPPGPPLPPKPPLDLTNRPLKLSTMRVPLVSEFPWSTTAAFAARAFSNSGSFGSPSGGIPDTSGLYETPAFRRSSLPRLDSYQASRDNEYGSLDAKLSQYLGSANDHNPPSYDNLPGSNYATTEKSRYGNLDSLYADSGQSKSTSLIDFDDDDTSLTTPGPAAASLAAPITNSFSVPGTISSTSLLSSTIPEDDELADLYAPTDRFKTSASYLDSDDHDTTTVPKDATPTAVADEEGDDDFSFLTQRQTASSLLPNTADISTPVDESEIDYSAAPKSDDEVSRSEDVGHDEVQEPEDDDKINEMLKLLQEEIDDEERNTARAKREARLKARENAEAENNATEEPGNAVESDPEAVKTGASDDLSEKHVDVATETAVLPSEVTAQESVVDEDGEDAEGSLKSPSTELVKGSDSEKLDDLDLTADDSYARAVTETEPTMTTDFYVPDALSELENVAEPEEEVESETAPEELQATELSKEFRYDYDDSKHDAKQDIELNVLHTPPSDDVHEAPEQVPEQVQVAEGEVDPLGQKSVSEQDPVYARKYSPPLAAPLHQTEDVPDEELAYTDTPIETPTESIAEIPVVEDDSSEQGRQMSEAADESAKIAMEWGGVAPDEYESVYGDRISASVTSDAYAPEPSSPLISRDENAESESPDFVLDPEQASPSSPVDTTLVADEQGDTASGQEQGQEISSAVAEQDETVKGEEQVQDVTAVAEPLATVEDREKEVSVMQEEDEENSTEATSLIEQAQSPKENTPDVSAIADSTGPEGLVEGNLDDEREETDEVESDAETVGVQDVALAEAADIAPETEASADSGNDVVDNAGASEDEHDTVEETAVIDAEVPGEEAEQDVEVADTSVELPVSKTDEVAELEDTESSEIADGSSESPADVSGGAEEVSMEQKVETTDLVASSVPETDDVTVSENIEPSEIADGTNETPRESAVEAEDDTDANLEPEADSKVSAEDGTDSMEREKQSPEPEPEGIEEPEPTEPEELEESEKPEEPVEPVEPEEPEESEKPGEPVEPEEPEEPETEEVAEPEATAEEPVTQEPVDSNSADDSIGEPVSAASKQSENEDEVSMPSGDDSDKDIVFVEHSQDVPEEAVEVTSRSVNAPVAVPSDGVEDAASTEKEESDHEN